MLIVAYASTVTFLPVGYGLVSNSAWIVNPATVVVLPMRLTITSRLTKGRPRQLAVIWQNIRCSILFHLLVPGGKWQTLTRSPASSANRCSSHFHSRLRLPLLPPPSATTNNSVARG